MSEAIHVGGAPFNGRWWLPDDPERKVGGQLDLDGEVWMLSLFGWLGPWEPWPQTVTPPEVLYGQIGATLLTIIGLAVHSFNASPDGAPHDSSFAVQRIIVGAHTTASARFSSASFRFLHLDEWANRRSWTSTLSTVDNSWRATMVYTDPGEIVASLPEATATLRRVWQGADSMSLSTWNTSSNEWVRFDFNEPLDFDTIDHDYQRPLANLISLAAGQRTSVLGMTLTPENSPPNITPWSVLSAEPRRRLPRVRLSFQFLFTLEEETFSDIIPAWWSLQARLGVVIDLLSSLREQGMVANRFLNGASAIEGYHRHESLKAKPSAVHRERLKRIKAALTPEDRCWLSPHIAHSHEPTFDERLGEILTKAGPLFPPVVGNVEEWRKWVKDARNSVAHRDPGMIDIEQEWRTTIRITDSIQCLLTLAVLRDLGISDAVLEPGVQREGTLARVAHYMKEVRPDWFAQSE